MAVGASACGVMRHFYYGARDGPITGVGAAGGQACLEADAATAHPFYWPRLSRFAALRIDSPYALASASFAARHQLWR